jgi:hypothetical protein
MQEKRLSFDTNMEGAWKRAVGFHVLSEQIQAAACCFPPQGLPHLVVHAGLYAPRWKHVHGTPSPHAAGTFLSAKTAMHLQL